MPNTEREPGSRDFLEQAQHDAARQRYGTPGALQDVINVMMADQDQAKRVNAAKAAMLGVDIDATVEKWASKNTSVFHHGTPQSVRWPASNPTATEKDLSPAALGPKHDVTMSEHGATSPETDMHVGYSSTTQMDVSSPESGELTGDSTTPNESEMSDGQVRNANMGARSSIQRFSLNTNNDGPKKEKGKRKRVTFLDDMPIPTLLPATPPVAESSRLGAARVPTELDTQLAPSLFVQQAERYPVEPLPKWYEDIKPNNLEMNKIRKKRPQALNSLEALKNCIGRCEDKMMQRSNVQSKNPKLLELFDELRNLVHKAEIYLPVDKYIVRFARILHKENGLPRIFQEDTQFPSDLKADSYQLYLRWIREDFEQNVLRGIITVKGPNRGSDRLDPKYRSKYPTTAKYYGDKGLIIGQCWPSQLCTVRDGAHGSSQGGIFGDKDKGAYSIVLSGGGGYNDQDNGDSIVYSGTDGQDFTPTEATQQMLRSAELGNEIRVIRSANLHRDNQYRPVIGFRYDGLYTIKGFELVDKEKQIHRFKLERCPGQDEIRYGDNAASRPTQYEIDEYKSLKVKHRWA
ncbi:hypothetical protein BDU57DRAFT_518903 [Ampelomyces quisqualis]|uniref:YDG domain-containing protein n=1 Tax=Ampelomyces quisqualis TaxID=50730 RepID=A0A6A5QF75_AMPQU|nr:hypothetical protein BDU57DRAFT_518903 [Ampelomyces quisqualis]